MEATMYNTAISGVASTVLLIMLPVITAASDNIALYELTGTSGGNATYERVWSGYLNNIENEPLLPGDIVLAPPSTGGGGGGGGGNCIPTPHDPCEHTQAPIIGDGGGQGIRTVAGNWEIIWLVNGGAGGGGGPGGGGSGGGGDGILTLPPFTVIDFSPPSFPSPSQWLSMWIGTSPSGPPSAGEPGVIGRPTATGGNIVRVGKIIVDAEDWAQLSAGLAGNTFIAAVADVDWYRATGGDHLISPQSSLISWQLARVEWSEFGANDPNISSEQVVRNFIDFVNSTIG